MVIFLTKPAQTAGFMLGVISYHPQELTYNMKTNMEDGLFVFHRSLQDRPSCIVDLVRDEFRRCDAIYCRIMTFYRLW